MARTTTIPATNVTEEIVNIHDIHLDKYLEITIGNGEIAPDGSFKFFPNQQYRNIVIKDLLYEDLITKHPNYVEADLWPYIDQVRSGAAINAPSSNYNWDMTSGKWIPNVNLAVTTKKKQIEVQRDQLRNAPFTIGGITINADDFAKSNIERKLLSATSASAIGATLPPEDLMWHDINDVDHMWADLPSYIAWLQNVACQLGQRESLIMRKSFVHKSNIKTLALTTDTLGNPDPVAAISAIESYDLTLGWA